jgi:hypothetical protein
MQDDALTRQQLGGHRLGEQRMARPMLTAAAGIGQQPRGGQLPKPAADIVDA